MFHKILARRMLCAAIMSGAALTAPGLAQAQPAPPHCSAADLAGIMSGITAATSVYLFTNPPVNDFFTTLKDVPAEEKRAALQAYVDANPQVKADLQGIRQPAVDFRNRCG